MDFPKSVDSLMDVAVVVVLGSEGRGHQPEYCGGQFELEQSYRVEQFINTYETSL